MTYDEDNKLLMKGVHPNYIVMSVKIGCPFVDPVLAIKWHNTMLEQDVVTKILDLTDYDWDKNPMGFKIIATKDYVDYIEQTEGVMLQ